jgi:NAD(P)-dependent dehydrogenase (short-subunit alcohol dehydrogenase family)
LINNAGLIIDELERNEDGIEMTLAINHFGHFYLTYLLFDSIRNASEGRIINVSSMAHYYAPKRYLADIECKQKAYRSNGQYWISKFMNVLFTQELSRRISKYPNIKTVSLHPGIVDSNFGNEVCLIKCFNKVCCCFYVTNVEGARTSIHLSTEEFSKLRNGEYYHSNTEWREMDERARDPVRAE